MAITQTPASACLGAGKSNLFISPPLNCILTFFSFFPSKNHSSKEPEQRNIPIKGPLATTSICMAEHISKHFVASCTKPGEMRRERLAAKGEI